MPTINISLPEAMRDFVDRQVTNSGYNSTSEYFRDLVRADQKRLAKEELERMLLESMSEPGEAMTRASWQALRKKAAARGRSRARVAS